MRHVMIVPNLVPLRIGKSHLPSGENMGEGPENGNKNSAYWCFKRIWCATQSFKRPV